MSACQTVPQATDALALNAIPPAPLTALPVAATAMPQGMPEQEAPPGFVSFCMRFEDQCVSNTAAPDIVQLDPAIWAKLKAANVGVNNALWPEEDGRHYGRPEYWTIPTDGYGDCEDYALVKRKLLASAGLPLRALRLAVVVTRRNNRHAVLTVATNEGDFVLDNENDDVLAWNQTDYDWVARQDTASGSGWVSFHGSPRILTPDTAESAVP